MQTIRLLTLVLIGIWTLAVAAEHKAGSIDYKKVSLLYEVMGKDAKSCVVRSGEDIREIVAYLEAARKKGIEMVSDPKKGPMQETPVGMLRDLRPSYGVTVIPRIEAESVSLEEGKKLRKGRDLSLYVIGKHHWVQALSWDPKSYWYVDASFDLKLPK